MAIRHHLTEYNRPALETEVTVFISAAWIALPGKLVAVIPAAEVPDQEALAQHFTPLPPRVNLKQIPIPKRRSKYERWVVERRPGRCFVFAMDKFTTFEVSGT